MNTQLRNQSGGVNIRAEKLYTQHEVDDLLAKKADNYKHISVASDIKEENHQAEKKQRTDNRTVANLVKKSNRILIGISSHALPFDFFPDAINVEEGRITIINRHFLSSEVHSVDIRDISNIFINRNFYYAELVIISRTFEDNEIRIRKLRTREAIFVRRIIEGLRIFNRKRIDTSSYTIEKLIAKLEELSTTAIMT
jgi:hypothetical protein